MKNINKTINTKGHFEKIGILTPEVLKAWRQLDKAKQDSDIKQLNNPK
jgi:hypothetical protein